MAGTLVITTLSDGTNSTSATNCIQGSAKAWANFDPSSGAITIRGSYNVSSITYNATGTYTMNFTNAMANANYVSVGAIGKYSPRTNDANAGIQFKNQTGNSYGQTTTALQISTRTPSGSSAEDNPYVAVAVFS